MVCDCVLNIVPILHDKQLKNKFLISSITVAVLLMILVLNGLLEMKF